MKLKNKLISTLLITINIIFYVLLHTIVFIILDQIDITKEIIIKDTIYVWITMLTIALFFILILLNIVLGVEKCNKLTKVDLYMISLYISSLILIYIYESSKKGCITYIALLIILLLILCHFSIKIIYVILYKENRKRNSITLKSLYENKIDNLDIISIEDEEISSIEDDLFNVSNFIESFSNIIKSNKNVTYGLIGKWGSGKTSILKIVQNKLVDSNTIVKFFSPLNYDNKETMIEGLYYTIFEDELNVIEFELLIGKGIKNVLSKVNDKLDITLSNLISTNKLEDYKKVLQKRIELLNKNIIVIIDDFDRMSPEEIIFTLKLIKYIMNLKGINYILCYDDKLIENKLEKSNYNKDYIDKFVQHKINVPKLSSRKKENIFKNCIKNILNKMSINIKEDNLDSTLDEINGLIETPREIILFINSILVELKMVKELNLDIADYLIISYIRFSNPNFYYIIYDTGSDMINHTPLYNIKVLLEKKDNISFVKYQHLLNLLFYEAENVLEKQFPLRCASAKGEYFKIFFEFNKNKYIEIKELIEKIINNKKITQSTLSEIIQKGYEIDTEYTISEIKKKSDEYNNWQTEYIIKYFIKKTRNNLNKELKYIDYITNLEENIIYKLISKNLKKYYQLLKKNSKILLMANMYNYIIENKNSINGQDINEIKWSYYEKAKNILDKNTDIFEKKEYHRGNFWALKKYCDEKDSDNSFDLLKLYINNVLTKKNIFAIISEFIVDNKLNKKELNKFIEDQSLIYIFSQIEYELNESQEAIRQAYYATNEIVKIDNVIIGDLPQK